MVFFARAGDEIDSTTITAVDETTTSPPKDDGTNEPSQTVEDTATSPTQINESVELTNAAPEMTSVSNKDGKIIMTFYRGIVNDMHILRW